MNMTPKGYVFWNESSAWTEKAIASSLAEATGKIEEGYTDYQTYDLYHVVNVETGKILESYWDYDDADFGVDDYSEMYPNAMIDIMYQGQPV